jgi:hypothetical protein
VLEAHAVEPKQPPRRRAEPEVPVRRLRKRDDHIGRAVARGPRAVRELRERGLDVRRTVLPARARRREEQGGAEPRAV